MKEDNLVSWATNPDDRGSATIRAAEGPAGEIPGPVTPLFYPPLGDLAQGAPGGQIVGLNHKKSNIHISETIEEK